MNDMDIFNVIYDEHKDEWVIILGKQKYIINVIISEKLKCEVYLNQQSIVIPESSKISRIGFDHILEIEGKKIHCVFQNEQFDIAIQGKYIKSRKTYIPIKGLLLFSIIALILLFLTMSLIITDTMTMLICVLLIGAVFLDIAFYDYLQKKAKKE